jgi:hypothetical protein
MKTAPTRVLFARRTLRLKQPNASIADHGLQQLDRNTAAYAHFARKRLILKLFYANTVNPTFKHRKTAVAQKRLLASGSYSRSGFSGLALAF